LGEQISVVDDPLLERLRGPTQNLLDILGDHRLQPDLAASNDA